MTIDRNFKKWVYIMMLIGYVVTFCLFAAVFMMKGFELNALTVIRWAVFICSPVMLNYIDIENRAKRGDKRKTGSAKSSLALKYLLISFVLLFSSAYVFFALEALNYIEGVASVACLVGASAVMSAIFSR